MNGKLYVYALPYEDALKNGEEETYWESYHRNIECAEAIRKAIDENYDGRRLNADCVRTVVDRFGYDRTRFVIANTLFFYRRKIVTVFLFGQRIGYDIKLSRSHSEHFYLRLSKVSSRYLKRLIRLMCLHFIYNAISVTVVIDAQAKLRYKYLMILPTAYAVKYLVLKCVTALHRLCIKVICRKSELHEPPLFE